uniref:Synaptopodin 2-like protein n=1 Tax=Schistocephalus solidus TaxID=70667 RepID=A0A0X3PYM7_SCHSO
MQAVEHVIVLLNGPPWGFRLQEVYPEGLVVSQIRQLSPADNAGLRENDKIVAIENISTLGMGRLQAVQIINNVNYQLHLIIQRLEKRRKQVMTFFLDTAAARGQQVQKGLTSKEVNLWWQKEPSPEPEPKPEPLIYPNDPDVTPVSIDRLMRQFEPPQIEHAPKRKAFANSAFYIDPASLYPSLEEQMQMAHRVADSIKDPENRESRGASMFELQRRHADKYVKEGPEPIRDPIENATAEDLEHMEFPRLPPRNTQPPSSYPNMAPLIPIPPPPPPPPGQPRSLQEFMDKVKLFPKNQHNQISPQVCFDIATALHSSNSRGANMFAQRKARAYKWEVGQQDSVGTPQPVPVQAQKPKLFSKLNQMHQMTTESSNVATVGLPVMRKTETTRSPRTSLTVKQETVSSWQTRRSSGETISPAFHTNPPETSKPTWRPVKFNIPQKAT